ncbi:FecR domain-containing protein [Stieleria sp. TO1_6]|uniref:LamG-like jellyroll fold domain-containing protein n=1 Tax=Stieleria tagensis TaxID=2956795 RepID=UPI00209A7D11|nr:LamG-like jellyroll fold domain-containing protein [Stieleria tagensis]MCO8121606.1 FecR domain-containing protein [Stieleria tagensis]
MSNLFHKELLQLVNLLIDGQLTTQQAAQLDDLLASSPEALAEYNELLDNHEALCAIYPGDVYGASLETGELPVQVQTPAPADSNRSHAWSGRSATGRALTGWALAGWALATAVLVAVGVTGYLLGNERRVAHQDSPLAGAETLGTEQKLAGHATLRQSIDLKWSDGSALYRDGDVLPQGLLQFDAGVAEIDFFCGATLIVEGPATLDLESDWSLRVIHGRLRANVPPAARGFVVKAADSEIIDLGTEFALEVGADNARVEVIDGEVKLRGGQHDGNHLVTGQRRWLSGIESDPDSLQDLSTINDLKKRSENATAERFEQWKSSSSALRNDPRLIAYYPISESQTGRVVHNVAVSGKSRDGKLVGPVERTNGRFGPISAGLEFDRPAARVRTRIDGEFQAFTFTCWARIDSLDHVYNALFMADGYENGEPHWQIRDDGRLMFSVMVDDTQDIRVSSRFDEGVVRDAGLHRVYFTEPIWDVSKSGQWFHIAAVYDPANQRVTQYVNGEQVANQAIVERFHIDTLRIGPAEIGNWGQPFRQTPWFAVRNLNGTIDELAIFNAALPATEIHSLYEQGKPIGY